MNEALLYRRGTSAHCSAVTARAIPGFFRTWTCKEAYLKATGDGLRRLKGLEVAVKPQQGAQFVNPQDWDLQEIQPGEGFVGAIAAPGFDWRVTFLRLKSVSQTFVRLLLLGYFT
ncbi:MAG: 4'-phosphopantetheinyl transferase superfamily protein [Alkalinema sp. RL_2_19]|nr:4'-phosphopantetheinyl transferase superfamily protein [Alkalinema sp. RL_2_19]